MTTPSTRPMGLPIACVDGVVTSAARATVSVFDRGFVLGDAALETARVRRGRAPHWPLHLERLGRSCEALEITSAESARDAVAPDVARVLEHAPLDRDSALRVVVTRGVAVPGEPARVPAPTRVVTLTELATPGEAAYAAGLRAVTRCFGRAQDLANGAKLGNYFAASVALREAAKLGADDVIVLDAGGRALEGATSNVFCVRGGVLETPPAGPSVLAGITRRLVLERCAPALGVAARQRAPTRDELAEADEVFLTSSLRLAISVVALDGHPVGDGRPGPVATAIRSALLALLDT